MAMTVIVTRNAPDRVRGFLASCACEIAPGVYTAPEMTKAVRERMRDAVLELSPNAPDVSVLITWPDAKAPGGQAFWSFGSPAVELVEHDSFYLARRDLSPDEHRRLATE